MHVAGFGKTLEHVNNHFQLGLTTNNNTAITRANRAIRNVQYWSMCFISECYINVKLNITSLDMLVVAHWVCQKLMLMGVRYTAIQQP